MFNNPPPDMRTTSSGLPERNWSSVFPWKIIPFSNRGLRSGLVGTAEQLAERLAQFERAGVDLVLLQFSPQLEEMEALRFRRLFAGIRQSRPRPSRGKQRLPLVAKR